MKIEKLENKFAICKVPTLGEAQSLNKPYFLSVTDEEISIVCDESNLPESCTDVEKGYMGFRVCGILDFSLTGIIARISALINELEISIFVVSTFNTDYVLVKSESFEKVLRHLEKNGYEVI